MMSKGYLCWDPMSHRMHISQDVTFDESRPLYPRPSSPLTSPIEDIYFLTFSNTPITQVLPLSTHPTVSSHTTIVDARRHHL